MRKILGTLILATIWLCAPHAAHAACSGSSPNYTAASASSTDIQACITVATHCGDIITVPSGTATWSSGSAVNVSSATGCAANTGLTIQGASTCSAGCAAGSGGASLAFTGDTTTTCGAGSTCITLSAQNALQVNSSNTAFVTITGFTFINSVAESSTIQLQSTHAQVGYRFHHNHYIDLSSGGVALNANTGYGLVDHYLYNSTGAVPGTPIIFGGIFSSSGYTDWSDTTTLGSNQSVIVEDSQATFSHSGAEGFFDGYFGCKLTVRYNVITGNQMGGWHGTDSGSYRGCVLGEIYNNTISNSNNTQAIMNTRSGILYFFNNTVSGNLTAIPLQLYRLDSPGPAETTSWGTALQGVNWTPIKVTTGSTCGSGDCVGFSTANAGDWTSSHSYTCSAGSPCVIGPTLHNAGAGGIAGGYNFVATSNCTSSGTEPNPWNQTVAGTQSDGSCTWTNIGGGTAASPNPGSADGFQTANPDTACSSGTCGRFLDANGGVYPFRDQPCVGHNQVVTPCYSWGNTLPGGVSASSLFTGDGTAVQSGRDFFNNTTPGGYTAYTYPDPLQGGTVVLSPSSENFGSINVGSSSAPITFTLTNNNATTATSISPSVTGGNSGDFSITNSGAGSCSAAGGSIATGASCTFTVTFSPTASGARSTTLSVSYSGGDGASPQTAALSGTGVSTGTAAGSSISGGVKISGGVTIK